MTIIRVIRPTQIIMEIAGYRDSRNVFHPVGQLLPLDAQPLRVVYEIPSDDLR